jgi:hypothetical protein
MSIYALVLFMHVSGVLVLCAALSIEVLSLIHLRGASTLSEASPWINPAPKLPLFAGGAVLVILVSGIYLALPVLPSGQAWPKVAVGALLLMAPLGAITDKRMRAIQRAYGIGKRANSELLDRLRDPALKVSLGIRIAVFFAIFLLVSIKPGLWESVSFVVVSIVLGLLSSLLGWRRSTVLSPPPRPI